MFHRALPALRRSVFCLVTFAAFGLAACGTDLTDSATNGKIQVTAAENFWGSIAVQLGGDKVEVTNIINNPDADPHDYEPTSNDATTFADAQYAIVNGAGYDAWAQQLLDANPVAGRTELDIGTLVGKKAGDNPHLWYSPDFVTKVANQITADYKKISPSNAAYFDQQNHDFFTIKLKAYLGLISDIKAKYAGTKVGATESIFAYLADGLGLDLITPVGFLNAISEGDEPTVADKATIDQQIADKEYKVFVYNTQNATPDVQALIDKATAAGIPISTVTETLTPSNTSFEDWQSAQLQSLESALAKGTGK